VDLDEQPTSEQHYRQERTAMTLALLLGCLGVDQFCAHHWALAAFKLLTAGGFGIWAFVNCGKHSLLHGMIFADKI
jgi:TM2 domain-containing membrane protein YozV